MGYGDVQMIDANGIRNDGRKAGDVRPISIELGVVPVADGSCRMRWGTNEVIAAIYGPMEAHPRKIQRQDRAVLDVRYNMAPFDLHRKSISYRTLNFLIYKPLLYSVEYFLMFLASHI